MQLQISSKIRDFGFVADCKIIQSTLSKIVSVLGTSASATKEYFLVAHNKNVYLIARSDDTFAAHQIEGAAADKDGSFGFTPDNLLNLTKGRNEMEFNLVGNEMKFKVLKGAYNGKFLITPITQDQAAIINSKFEQKASKGGRAVITREAFAAIKRGIGCTAIKDVFNSLPIVHFIEATDKSIRISANDNHHFSQYSAKVKCSPFKVAMPSVHFSTIDRMTEGQEKITFLVTTAGITVTTDVMTMSLPGVQVDDNGFSLVTDFLKNLAKPALSVELDAQRFSNIADNLFALYTVKSTLGISYSAKKLNMAVDTQNGSASDALKVDPLIEAKVAAKVDPRLLKDILPLLPTKQALLHVIPGSVLKFEAGKDGEKVVVVVAQA